MSRFRVGIVDYGAGNIRSVAAAIARLGYVASVSNSPTELATADALVLPGVGAFGPAIARLRQQGLDRFLCDEVVAKQTPLLGICLGMQMLADSSEEDGHHEGLGLVPGKVLRLPVATGLRIPHVGWNDVVIHQNDPLFVRTEGRNHFYFDHSFYFDCPAQFRAADVDFGRPITAAVRRDNVLGVQFHPEKSQQTGLRLLRGFFMAAGAPAC